MANHMNNDVSQTRSIRGCALPTNCPSRGLCRQYAAAYLGISSSLFDQLVKAGEAPKPKRFRGRVVWDRHKLDLMFEEPSDEIGRNPFD